MKKFFCLALVASGLACVARAGIAGDTVQIDWWYPNAGNTYTSSSVVVPGAWYAGSGAGNVTVNDGTITIENTTAGWSGASFNGFAFTDLSQIPNFNSLSLVSVTGYPPPIAPSLTFNADQLFINFTPTGQSNIADGAGQVYTFAFTEGNQHVPDSGSTLLLLAGGMLALVGYRRRAKA